MSGTSIAAALFLTLVTVAPPARAQTPPAGTPNAAKLDEIEERKGPFTLDGQDFTVVVHEVRLVGQTGPDNQTLAAIDILDSSSRVQHHQSFSHAIENGDFVETCSAGVQRLSGSAGQGLLVNTGCLPSAPLSGGPWQIFGVVSGKLVPFGKPLITDGELGDFVPGAVNRIGNRVEILSDSLTIRVWSGYFFVPVRVRIDWLQGRLALGDRCMYQTGSGFADEGCERPLEERLSIRREQDTTFVRMFPESSERIGPPAHVVITKDSKVDIVASKVFVTWNEGPDAVDLSAGDDVWLKIRVDGKEGWIHTEEDLNALGLFRSG